MKEIGDRSINKPSPYLLQFSFGIIESTISRDLSTVHFFACCKHPTPTIFENECTIYAMSGNIGVPIKLLYEAEGMKITVEMKNGEIYRGLLLGAEDTMNVNLSDVLRTARNGQISKLPNVYLRGSSIRFIALPDLLKSAPIFQKVQTQKRKLEESIAQKQGGVVSKKRKTAS
jgi:small nuclear ribonucleoprotein D3